MSHCIKYISHNQAFKSLSPSELNVLNKDRRTIKYKKGEVIQKQGTIVHEILFIKEGLIKIILEGAQKEIILTLKRDGNFVGLSSLYNVDKTHLYTAKALVDCEIDVYDVFSFDLILQSNLKFCNEIIKFINNNSARIYNRFLCIAEKNARGKVADMVLCFANRIYENREFSIPMSRKELSEFVGLSMENTIRILKEFESDKLINLEGKNFVILDIDTLERIREYG